MKKQNKSIWNRSTVIAIVLLTLILLAFKFILPIFFSEHEELQNNRIIVMKYNPDDNSEIITAFEFSSLQEYISLYSHTIKDIKYHNRYMRFIDLDNCLVYIRNPIKSEWYFMQNQKEEEVKRNDDFFINSKLRKDYWLYLFDQAVSIEKIDLQTGINREMKYLHLHYLNRGTGRAVIESLPPTTILVTEDNNFILNYSYTEDFYRYSQYNPISYGEKILYSYISIDYQFLILNYRAYLEGEGEFIETLKTEYDDLFKPTSLNIEQEKTKGQFWNIYLGKTENALSIDIKDHSKQLDESIYSTKERLKRLVSSYPMYIPKKQGIYYILPIPNKCWSPSGDMFMFVGSLEEPGVGNVYIYDLAENGVTKFLDINDRSLSFNPDLDWTTDGALITCKDDLYYSRNLSPPIKINVPSGSGNFRNGRISPDGKFIMFFGSKNEKAYLFVKNISKKKYLEIYLGEDVIENYQGAWINENSRTIIRNWQDSYIVHYYLPFEIEHELKSHEHFKNSTEMLDSPLNDDGMIPDDWE